MDGDRILNDISKSTVIIIATKPEETRTVVYNVTHFF